MTTSETELRGLKSLIEQTKQRAKAYAPRIDEPEAKHQVELIVDGLSDMALALELTIKKLTSK